MADKIVPLVDIDITTIFYQLHVEAQKKAEAEASGAVDVINFGVDIDNKTFIGAGDFIVLAQHNEKDTSQNPKDDPDKFKEECKKALVAYITTFIGKDIADKIDDDTLIRIDTPAQVSERQVAHLPLSKLLLEAEPSDKNQSGIGYYVEYSVAIEGQKKYKWTDLTTKYSKLLTKSMLNALKSAGKGLAKGLFGNVFDDIKSLKMNIGGKDYNIGKSVGDALAKVAKGISDTVTIAGQKFKKVFGKTDIRDLDQNFTKEIHNKFTNSTAHSTIYPTNTVVTMLNKAHRLDADIRDKLMNNGRIFRMEYVIVLQVDKKDENYPQYDVKTLHSLFVKAIKETKGMSAFKDLPTDQFFSEDDIIKVDDFENALGVAKLRKPSSPIESLQQKNQFLKLVLESNIVNEATADEMKKQIARMLKSDDPTKSIDDYKLKRLARSIRAMKDDAFDALLKIDGEYDKKGNLANALEFVTSEEDLNDILDKFVKAANIEELLDQVKTLYGKDIDISAKKAAITEKGDMYIFCLTNVIRQTDEEKSKETATKKG